MNKSELDGFHDELRAAVIARVPIQLSDARSWGYGRQASLSLIDEFAGQVRTEVSPLADSFAETLASQTHLPIRYRAALRVFDATKSMPTVLKGLATAPRARREVSRLLFSSILYVLLVLLVACGFLHFFDIRIVPILREVRADIQPLPGMEFRERLDATLLIPTLVHVLNFALHGLILFLLLGGSVRLGSWLGGRPYIRRQVLSVAARTTQKLVASGMNINTAMTLACELVQADEKTELKVQSLIHNATTEVTPTNLAALADYHRSCALSRLAFLKFALPISFVSIIGGTTALACSFVMFWPLITLIEDLALPAK